MAELPKLPDIPQDDLPGGQPIDPRTFLAIDEQIRTALEQSRAVFLNDLQLDLLITYARHCSVQHIPLLPRLAAGAYHAFRTRGVVPECKELYEKLGRNEVVTGLEERFRSKLSVTFEGGVVTSASPKDQADPSLEPDALSRVLPRRNYIQDMQAALRMGNFDGAVDAAEYALGVLGGPSPEILVSAAICFHLRAAKGGKDLPSKLEDIDRAIELFREFLLGTKGKEQYEGTRQQVQKRLQDATKQRLEILKRVKRRE